MDRLVICHRGVIREKENTLESITAIENVTSPGIIPGIEFDVQLLYDGTVACYHDYNLSRIHNISKNITDLCKDQLNQFGITTLDVILDKLSSSSGKFVDIEVKIYDQGRVNLIVDTIHEKLDNTNLNTIVVTSFNTEFIETFLKKDRTTGIGLILYDNFNIDQIKKFIEMGMEYLVVHKSIYKNIADYKLDVKILIYTIFDNPDNEIDDLELISSIDPTIGIITDKYNKTVDYLSSL